ncbi:MAG: gas vesicle protein GvpFL, partial [Betaproteobacteria bacterium]|nr:gas vesicle protein GvpFL [Betaproteobacteria bacterium]
MSDILDRILQVKRREIAAARREASEADLQQRLTDLARESSH